MPTTTIRIMDPSDEYYAGTCSHVSESAEIDACARRRLEWIAHATPKGARVLVAHTDAERSGFLFLIPIEICPWGPLGEDLLVIPCLSVPKTHAGHGVGAALLAEAEAECHRQRRKGLVVLAYRHDFWFMPAGYFERQGYSAVRTEGRSEILWKIFDLSAKPPVPLRRHYEFEPVQGRVAVDLFWNTFCETSNIEAERVREVAAEFGDSVQLRLHCADERSTLLRYQIPRGIFVNGREIGWGYEAPRDGIRQAIREALAAPAPDPA